MAEGQEVAKRAQVRLAAGRIELEVLEGDRTLASAAMSPPHAVKLQDDLGSALLEGVSGSRWKCPKCGSTHVQVSLPTWYRETSDGTLISSGTARSARSRTPANRSAPSHIDHFCARHRCRALLVMSLGRRFVRNGV